MKKITYYQDKLQAAAIARDREIYDLHEHRGLSIRAIARVAGVSPSRIQQILQRAERRVARAA